MVSPITFNIIHHGAVDGVTGSCHELKFSDARSVLVDCGLFQGAETAGDGARTNRLEVLFPVSHIQALVVTHVHIDNVGRIPYLLAAGYAGPILCSEVSARLLPMVLEDALKVGFTRKFAGAQAGQIGGENRDGQGALVGRFRMRLHACILAGNTLRSR